MIESEYYKNYNGPRLIKATMNDIVDITDIISEKYGENCNWQGKIWTYSDIFGSTSEGTIYYCEFKSDDGRKHWFHGFVDDVNQYFNPPLSTP